MGCIVSQSHSARINIVETPRAIKSLDLETKAPTHKAPQEMRRMSRRNNTPEEFSQNMGQVIFTRMESSSKKKKKGSGGENFALRRASTILGIKDGVSNEFSFKNSVDSYHERNSSSISSSRHHLDNSRVNSSREINKMNSIDPGISLNGSGLGLKRTMTPSFSRGRSAFFLERHDSSKNMRSKTMIPIAERNQPFLEPTATPNNHELETLNEKLNPNMNSNALEKRFVVDFPNKLTDPQLFKMDIGFGTSEIKSLSKKSTVDSQPNSERTLNLQQSQTQVNSHLKAVQENNSDNEKVESTIFRDESKEKTITERERPEKKAKSTHLLNLFGAQREQIEMTDQGPESKPVTILEPLTIKINNEQPPKLNRTYSGSKTSDSDHRLHAGTNIPIRALPLLKTESTPEGTTALSKSKLATVNPLNEELSSIIKLERSNNLSRISFLNKDGSISDLSHRPNAKKFFSGSSKLSVKDRFKRNLLDIVNNEDDDISPIISRKPKPDSTLAKSLFPDKFSSDKKSEKNKPDLNTKKQNESRENSPSMPVVMKENVNLKEALQHPQLNVLRARDPPNIQSATLSRKGLEKLSKNLLALAREEHIKKETVSAKLPQRKADKRQSNDFLSANATIPWSLVNGENNLRPTLIDNDPYTSNLGSGLGMNPPSSRLAAGSNQNIQNQTLLTIATPKHLSESYNPSINNVDGNVTAMNLSNYVFYYENEEVEYDEAKGGSILTSHNPEQKLLLGITSSPSNKSSGFSPINHSRPIVKSLDERRDSVWSGRTLQLMSTSPQLRRDSVGTQLSSPLLNAKKESFSSLYSNGQGFSDQYQSVEIQSVFKGQQSETPSEDNTSLGSPLNLKKFLHSTDSNKHKPFKISIFQQEPEGATESGINSQLDDLTPTTVAQSKNNLSISATLQPNNLLKKSKSCLLSPLPEETEYSASQRVDESQFESQREALQVPEQNLLTPTSSMNDLSPMLRGRTLSTPKSPALKGVVLKRTQTNVIETSKLDKTRDEEGQKKINQYLLIKDIGRGGFGKVKLAQDSSTNQYFAVKIANKAKMKRNFFTKTKDVMSSLQAEIAIMKKLEHPNVVRLWEVIDDPKEDKLYLVMDLIKKGAVMSKVYWNHQNKAMLDRSDISAVSHMDISMFSEIPTGKRVLSEEKALKYFRDLILGLDYLHNHVGVIHRDIKPENLLIDEYDHLKISDFGVSLIMEDNSDELNNNAGTKLFLPPESFEGKSFKGKPADIWAAGATLFFFLTGKPPFFAATQSDLMKKVFNEEPVFPETMNKKIQEVIKGCLQKDPEQRFTLQQIMTSDWVTEDGEYIVKNIYEGDDQFKLSEQEIQIALTKLNFRAVVKIKAKFKRHLDRTRDNIEKRRISRIGSGIYNPGKSADTTPTNQKEAVVSRMNLLKAIQ